MQSQTTPSIHIPLQFVVEYRYSYARESDTGLLKNISLSGAFIESHSHRFHPNDKIKLTFKVGGRTRQIQAQVVWVHHGGAGVQFSHVNNQDKQIVDDLMYFVESRRNSRRNVLNSIFSKVEDESTVENVDSDESFDDAA
ncbi:MAG: PilZ domain-containing protein [Bdellovibrionales bacterium]